MGILEQLPKEEAKKIKDLVIFGNLERINFEETLPKEEAKEQYLILHDIIQARIKKIIHNHL